MVVCDNESETALYAAYVYARYMSKLLKTSTQFDESTLSQSIEEIVKHLDIEDAINRDAKSARNAVDRLVSTAVTARGNVLKVLTQFGQGN
jgi:ribosomal protein L17